MTFLAPSQKEIRQEVEAALERFADAGAEFMDVPTLLPAGLMLDIYGEDIRNRAFLVHDGVEGDYVLRPDFTVPVVKAHLARGQSSARYAYSGRVWRKKRDKQTTRQHSFWQIGFEIFDANRRAENDAEIFAMASEIARPHGLMVRTGDLGLVFTLLDQIEMPAWRREALKRQFWRPRAFKRLLERYSGGVGKHADLAEEISAPVIGLRSEAMIHARIKRLREDAKIPPMKSEDKALLLEILNLQGSLAEIDSRLEALAQNAQVLEPASEQFAKRNAALKAAGIDVNNTHFSASFGRETMEYYDGFVFGFYSGETSVIAGGRYDRLAQSFGADHALSAVGMAYRPELFLGENT